MHSPLLANAPRVERRASRKDACTGWGENVWARKPHPCPFSPCDFACCFPVSGLMRCAKSWRRGAVEQRIRLHCRSIAVRVDASRTGAESAFAGWGRISTEDLSHAKPQRTRRKKTVMAVLRLRSRKIPWQQMNHRGSGRCDRREKCVLLLQ